MRITASDRSSLIKLASSLPPRSKERRAILSGLTKVGMEFDTKEALEAYLKDHPGADKSLHSVKKEEKEEKGKGTPTGSMPTGKDLVDLFHPTDLVWFTKPSYGNEKRVDLSGQLKKIPAVTDAVSAGKAAQVYSAIKNKMYSHKSPHTPVRKRLWDLAVAGEQLNQKISEGKDLEDYQETFDKALSELKAEIKKSGLRHN